MAAPMPGEDMRSQWFVDGLTIIPPISSDALCGEALMPVINLG
jgi:hypothetical protein